MKKSKIRVGRKYRTRSGEVAIISSTSEGGLYPIHGTINTFFTSWTRNGREARACKSGNDLIEEIPDPTIRSRYIIFSPDHEPFLTDDLETAGYQIIVSQVVSLEKLEWADSYIEGTAEWEWKKLSE